LALIVHLDQLPGLLVGRPRPIGGFRLTHHGHEIVSDDYV
jgi:hypothetical protein